MIYDVNSPHFRYFLSQKEGSSDESGDGTFHFPEELIAEILHYLPVKPLLRFRSVSKPWCSLIDSTKFVKKHLHKTIECNRDSGIIVTADKEDKNFYLADVDSFLVSTAMEIADPLKTQLSGAQFAGSCNGLACLWKNDEDIILWNPATRKCRKLPKAPDMIRPDNLFGVLGCASYKRLMASSILGFGYDHVNDDYKVLRTCDSQLYGIMVNVYSLRSDSWTRGETITNRIRLTGGFGTFSNGVLYWLEDHESMLIFAFDLEVEKHRELPFPAGVTKKSSGRGLTVFNGCLCLIDHHSGSHTDIWQKNNDNGVESSWSKILSVEQRGILGSFDLFLPIAFSKARNDFLLVVDYSKFVWYNRERNEIKNVTIHGFPAMFDPHVYTESLVQPSYDFKLDGKPKHSEKKTMNKKSKFPSKGSKGLRKENEEQ